MEKFRRINNSKKSLAHVWKKWRQLGIVGGHTPPSCNMQIFQNGSPILAIDGSSSAVEKWVRSLGNRAKSQVDWHYSGGIAQVLHLGNEKSFARTASVANGLESTLEGRIMRRYSFGGIGLFRSGVDPLPEGTIAGFYADGETEFMVEC